MTLDDTWYLKRASLYANPLNDNNILPVVFGNLTDGNYGIWEVPCIDTVNHVYCFAAHAVRSQTIQVWVKGASVDPSAYDTVQFTDSGSDTVDISGVLADPDAYSAGDVLVDPSRYTFNESNNYESKGNIATITFDDDMGNATIIVKGYGKNDSNGDLMENPIDIINDILTVENSFTSAIYNTTSKAMAKDKCRKNDYKAAGIINNDVVLWDLLQEIAACFLGAIYYDANKELCIDIDDNTAIYSGATIIPQRDIYFRGAAQSLENLINRCPATYRFNYVSGKYHAYDDGEDWEDLVSQSVYGLRVPENAYQFPWCRNAATVNKVQELIVEKFKNPLWIVDIDAKSLKYHNLDVNDVICATIKDLFGKDLGLTLNEYINQFFKIVSVEPNYTEHKIALTLHDSGKYLTGNNFIADGSYMADGSIMAGNLTRDINEY